MKLQISVTSTDSSNDDVIRVYPSKDVETIIPTPSNQRTALNQPQSFLTLLTWGNAVNKNDVSLKLMLLGYIGLLFQYYDMYKK